MLVLQNLNLLDLRPSLNKASAERNKEATKTLIKVVMRDQELMNRQVVTTQESNKKEPPKDSKYLSRENQVVDRQTIAKVIDKFNEGGGGGKKLAQKNVKPSNKKKLLNGKGKVSLADLSNQVTPEQRFESMAVAEVQGIGTKGKGLSSNNDYIEDVPLGDMTLLNTTEFKYYGFYFRIRQQLEQYWGKTLHEKANNLYKSGRRLEADTDKITSLTIYLDPKGNIIEVAVKSTSGVKELDDAAVESFNRAGPFPNPPKGMVSDGMVKIEWGFVVKG